MIQVLLVLAFFAIGDAETPVKQQQAKRNIRLFHDDPIFQDSRLSKTCKKKADGENNSLEEAQQHYYDHIDDCIHDLEHNEPVDVDCKEGTAEYESECSKAGWLFCTVDMTFDIYDTFNTATRSHIIFYICSPKDCDNNDDRPILEDFFEDYAEDNLGPEENNVDVNWECVHDRKMVFIVSTVTISVAVMICSVAIYYKYKQNTERTQTKSARDGKEKLIDEDGNSIDPTSDVQLVKQSPLSPPEGGVPVERSTQEPQVVSHPTYIVSGSPSGSYSHPVQIQSVGAAPAPNYTSHGQFTLPTYVSYTAVDRHAQQLGPQPVPVTQIIQPAQPQQIAETQSNQQALRLSNFVHGQPQMPHALR